ncbi:MAG: hypothetical protein KGI50_04025 [Patescibacteria group bacterium]|nr:hypothetical protein [Patescibacteria group bacterium]MDE2438855.1 hypothetical protein [Patescibacteria group bacterium]
MSKEKTLVPATSRIWHTIFLHIELPCNGVVVEIAPGYEPKIGRALSLLDFAGIVYVVEPDLRAAAHIEQAYKRLLPRAKIRLVCKLLQDVVVGVDLPTRVDALVANHPFDDMVMAYRADRNFFSKEKHSKTRVAPNLKKWYDSLKDDDYALGIKKSLTVWKAAIRHLRPHYVVVSQYPSRALAIKKLYKREESGVVVLRKLQEFYRNYRVTACPPPSCNAKSHPRWWLVAKYSRVGFIEVQTPAAMDRLGRSLFVPQRARLLLSDEYDIVYKDNTYFNTAWKKNSTLQNVRQFALVLHHDESSAANRVLVYADRQKDKTDISLSGNIGSGRAVYCGDDYNILGVGKTTLCRSTVPSHSTGEAELIGAMRRVILAHWINRFMPRVPVHPLLFALRHSVLRKWNANPIPLALLVRVDGGSLDRPSHVEQNPEIPIDFENMVREYAMLDAECFAYRFMLGAWSMGNYSLSGHLIDLESASFVRYRGPYYTSSSHHLCTRFGHEGTGLMKVLHRLTEIKHISDAGWKKRFVAYRKMHLARCMLSLLGVNDVEAALASSETERIIDLSHRFEILSKKIRASYVSLNLYSPLPGWSDPSLLDMSELFRNIAHLYSTRHAEEKAFDLLLRTTAFAHIESAPTSLPQGEEFLKNEVVTVQNQGRFVRETRRFVRDLFWLLHAFDRLRFLNNKAHWAYGLAEKNQNFLTMHELNTRLIHFSEQYRVGNMDARALGREIERLCRFSCI